MSFSQEELWPRQMEGNQRKAGHGRGKYSTSLVRMKVLSGFLQDNFGSDAVFPEGQIIKMGKTSMKILQLKDEEFYEGMGAYFIDLARELGYSNMLFSLGRKFRDFFTNLDNLHDYLKFSFPRFVSRRRRRSKVTRVRSPTRRPNWSKKAELGVQILTFECQ